MSMDPRGALGGALRRVSHRTNRAVEKDQSEDSYLWKRPRGIETTRSRARPRKGALPFRSQHAPVALGADESGNLGVCIVSIPQYRSASTSCAVARSREVDAASSHTAPGDVVAPWPDATTRALRRAAVQWHARVRAADRPHLVPLVDERSLYVSRRGCIQAYLCHSSAGRRRRRVLPGRLGSS